MKRLLLFLSLCFICTATIAHTINWYVDGSVYHTTTCESGEDVTPPVAPEKYGYTFKEWNAYVPIEYLESTGTQWIDTGEKFTGSDRIVSKWHAIDEEDNFALYGGSNGSIATGERSLFWNINNKIDVVTPQNIQVSYVQPINNIWYINKDYIIDDDLDCIIINNQIFSKTTVPTMFESLYNFYIFGITRDGVKAQWIPKVRLKQFTWYRNNIVFRDFIPVLDKDGVPCMYDLVEHKFYYNSGTGKFIAGPIVGE